MDKVVTLLTLVLYFTGLYFIGKCALNICTKVADSFNR